MEINVVRNQRTSMARSAGSEVGSKMKEASPTFLETFTAIGAQTEV
ncbi:hypothetical protein COLO4_08170 [Corchorus olitorius]|uniref:Uncharacterized protein n=1 Tax=Corchorus olitorius TaxID=93759 RepID=A0A1R3KH62_9ROSI|nr:hypothetical protein COLO4_08170 [Corchorus olitorius]